MRWLVLSIFAAGFLAGQANDNAVERDMNGLQGNWTVASIEVNGSRVPEDKMGGRDAAFKGDQYTIHDFRLTIKIDPTKKP
jgi:uncharacterized protein (TIGR03067 family)